MSQKYLVVLIALIVSAPASARAAGEPTPGQIRSSVNRSLALIQKSLAEYPRHNTCFSCHHQGAPALALSLANSRGYRLDEKSLPGLSRHAEADLKGELANYKSGKGQPGGVTRAGYALLALDATGTGPDEVTQAVADFLLQHNKDREFWHDGSNRPPSEASAFTDTYLVIRALNRYSRSGDREAVSARVARAQAWLQRSPAKETEDRVFQLLGLKESGASPAVLAPFAKSLLALQQGDGGWAQLPGGTSDAYATGSVLTALNLSGQLAASDPAYHRAAAYLVRTQEADGSWHVVSRSKPFQPYFESGFPHGKHQFISMAASAWATAALVLEQASAD